MTTLSVKSVPRYLWSADTLIPGSELGFFCQFFEFFDNDRAAGQKHRQTRPDIVVEHEKLEFAPELSMVALLRFLEHRKVIIKFLPGFEGCAVNALELRIRFVAFVVRARNAGEL